MDTSVWGWKDRTPEQVVGMLKELGYDGYGHSGTEDIPQYLQLCKQHGLRFFNTYVGLNLDRSEVDPALLEAARQLQGTEAMLWVPVTSRNYDRQTHTGDDTAVERIRLLADTVLPDGVKIALYPHSFFYIETADDAIRIAEKVNRRNVGVTFNLCHHLRIVGERDIERHLARALPYLFQVSINGADSGETTQMGWNQLIQPLDTGTYDVGRFLGILRRLGYHGPIGLQGFGIKGDPRTNLHRSIQAWKALKAAQMPEALARP
jgi:sugar phosphate isomerase/epimerase